MTNQQGAPEALLDPSPDQLRAIARTARNSSGSASDDCGPLAYVLHGWRAAAIAFRAQQAALVEAQQPAPSAAARFDEQGFRDWVLRNMPDDTIIGSSAWWADHLTKWAKAFANASPQPSPTPQADSAPAEAVQRIVHLRTDRERRVYVAGPMTGLPEYNFPLFNATAARLRSEGWHVENPAEHGHVDGAGWSDYLRWDISRIATCGAIYLLPGWSKSKGATLEVHIAGVLGLQVLLADGAEAPQADSQPAPDEAAAMNRTRELAEAGRWPSDWVDAYRRGYSDRAASAPADSVLEDAARLEQIAEAIRDYHYALDTRKHGGVAESAAFNSICLTMGMHWEQGKEADRRTALAANGGKP